MEGDKLRAEASGPKLYGGASISSVDSSISTEILDRRPRKRRIAAALVTISSLAAICGILRSGVRKHIAAVDTTNLIIGAPPPFSTINPLHLGVIGVHRPESSRPTATWGELRNVDEGNRSANLPTNAWWENVVLGSDDLHREGPFNTVVALPYTMDCSGPSPGLRVHYPRTYAASDLIVNTEYDWRRAMQLGSVHPVGYHIVRDPGPLSITLEWSAQGAGDTRRTMQAPIVRGAPYATMEYRGLAPNISCMQPLAKQPIIDGETMNCSGTPFLVKKEVELAFKSDSTWLIFISQPTMFICKTGGAGDGAGIELAATAPMDGVVRAALLNNCTTGQSWVDCDEGGKPRNHDAFKTLLREHADTYPTGDADIGYLLPKDVQLAKMRETDAIIDFKWGARSMSAFRGAGGEGGPAGADAIDAAAAYAAKLAAEAALDTTEDQAAVAASLQAAAEAAAIKSQGFVPPRLLMYSLPHHREVLLPATTRSVGDGAGAVRTLHGVAELVEGDSWSMRVPLHAAAFHAPRKVRPEMLDDINAALDVDLEFDPPDNYKTGAGDTYFSGKMLAKMARIALIAEEVGRHKDAMRVAARLKEYAQVWLNGSALAPLLYDHQWGGVISCGCNYDEDDDGVAFCANAIGPGCPGLNDVGQNFGAGFFNDLHFHYGYHIYSAAVIAKFYPEWGMQYYDRVMLLVRTIANPSPDDPFFPPFRHKDWFLGSSWALGIPTLAGVPYGNGRNAESSSESVAAYDAVALYGTVMAEVFAKAGDAGRAQSASHVRRTGRLLLSTEIKAAQNYWHVRPPGTPNVSRIYPDGYRPHVVGMLWSTLAQMQTWFGGEAWKIYGIQMLPLLPISETLLEKDWITELLPDFENSCLLDTNPAKQCISQGWSVIYHCGQAIAGNWTDAWKSLQELPESVFHTAGGNGHSRTNSLWFIATRDD